MNDTAHRLGASLYIPAINTKLGAALKGGLFPYVRSIIVCTEDAIAAVDLPRALEHLREVLTALPPRPVGPLRFIRPRNANVLEQILAMYGIDRIHGFVLPKADTSSLPAYEKLLVNHDFWVMPTLETPDILDIVGQRELRIYLQRSSLNRNILALRIGGNDLLRILALKRARGITLYETAIGLLIQQLVLSFRLYGFHLTAPVYDFIDDPETLVREARADVAMGLIGKTAIHPTQVPVIEQAFSVSDDDFRAARKILETDSSVFSFDGAMMEPIVHSPWAHSIIARKSAEM